MDQDPHHDEDAEGGDKSKGKGKGKGKGKASAPKKKQADIVVIDDDEVDGKHALNFNTTLTYLNRRRHASRRGSP
jgi:hypothetical protein